ncbi:SDR family oxidoreductase [Rhodococcus fascians]|nr:SDR family oxidoreductase [Rhodococcus fascians]MBY4238359.1 SDR family oxidoreductase [Rhodococcus fascians]MBY4254260.1 SDR family oxidoreductase [Rhodococcus fascians]MBY4269641.1 SDR family oxidoreductase [Rhodococcus fascians]
MVTGGASGIGAAIVRRVHREGATVVVADRNASAANELVDELTSSRIGSAIAVELDVSSSQSWAELAERVADNGVDALVNNAGITRDRTMMSMSEDDFDAVVGVHVRGAWLGSKNLIPFMRKAGGGSIVNISSSGRHGAFGQTNYSSAKAAVVGLTKSTALEQAKYGIRCNAVAPGAIDTPMLVDVPNEVRQGWLEDIALRRLGNADEIAAAVAFLLSDDASYITATVLDVNGGETHL